MNTETIRINKSRVVEIVTLIIFMVGGWYQLKSRIDMLERDSQRYDRDQTMIEFKLLQQQVTGQDEDLAVMMKATNQILLEIQEIKLQFVRNHQ